MILEEEAGDYTQGIYKWLDKNYLLVTQEFGDMEGMNFERYLKKIAERDGGTVIKKKAGDNWIITLVERKP